MSTFFKVADPEMTTCALVRARTRKQKKEEGQTWEALQALAFHNLDNVRVIVDVNRGQCDGPMSEVMNI